MDWNSADKITDIQMPIFIATGMKDVVVAPVLSYMLHELATSSVHKTMFIEENGGHFDTWLRDVDRYISELDAFMTAARSMRGQHSLAMHEMKEKCEMTNYEEVLLTENVEL